MKVCGPSQKRKKNESAPVVRTAEYGGQTVNVDLCFVPWEHPAQDWLPAVSGSSGHLVISHRPTSMTDWPGQSFQQVDLSYDQAMRCYAARTRDRLVRGKIGPHPPEQEKTGWRKDWEARADRYQVLQRRRQEDTEWLAERKAHHQIVEDYRALTRKGRAAVAVEWQAQKVHWAQREQDRLAVLAQRKIENEAWHAHNRQRAHKDATVWIAILVLADNATRQCLGLQVFAGGVHVSTHEVAEALRALLPPGLEFLISDQGPHFRSRALAQLAQEAEFVHILVYRHRPQTNGIAERFVRTLKDELHPCSWSGPEELQSLLEKIVPAYNDRPHQGLPIPGLSPNEYAKRLWLM